MGNKTRAQSITDYIILLGIVATVVIAVFPMVKRGTQSIVRSGVDLIANQVNSEQSFTVERGYMDSMNVITYSNAVDKKTEWPGVMQTEEADRSIIRSRIYTNLGFTEDQ